MSLKQESSSQRAAFFMNGYTGLIGWGIPQAMILASAHYCFQLHQGNDPEFLVMGLIAFGTMAIYGLDRFLEFRFQKQTARRHQVGKLFNLGMLLAVAFGFIFLLSQMASVPWTWLTLLALLGGAYLSVTLPLIKTIHGVKEVLGALCWVGVVYGPYDPPDSLKAFAALIALFLLGFSNFAWAGHQDHDRDAVNNVATLSQLEPALNVEMARIVAAISVAAFAFAGPSPNAFQISALAHGAWIAPWRRISVDWCFLPLVITMLLNLTGLLQLLP
jgi:hypothetical protein